ncbi:MAG: M20/M25/M40 family metallo-hydrolase [Desulforhopalus sp.]
MRKELLDFLERCEPEQFKLLEGLVLQPSFSRYKEGVDAVGRLITDSLQGTGMSLETVSENELGDHLIFRSPGFRAGGQSVLLVGHMDTVFPVDSGFNFYRENGNKVHGPGVIDMKGGLVVTIFAIKALAARGLLKSLPLTFICNSDEEIGSPSSAQLIRAEAGKAAFGLGFECGGMGGEVVTGRKGKMGYKLSIQGRAGHAAFAGPEKMSAILELAHKVIALEQLNDPERKIVVNVGVVTGGVGPNSIAESAMALIDTRFLEQSDAIETDLKIAQIVAEQVVAGTQGVLQPTSSRLPMEQTDANKKLFRLIRQQSEVLGIACREELRSGVSDANTMAEAGIPVVDGLGPIGDCDHSDREYMVRDSLLARTKLAALTILGGWESFRNPVDAG